MRRELWLTGATLAVVLGAGSALSRVFTLDTWRPSALAAVLLSLGLAAASRRVGFGAGTSLLVSLVGLFVVTYVVLLPSGPLVPGPTELRELGQIARDGIVQLQEQPAPTPPLEGLRLLVIAGGWVVTHLTHELLVRWRRPLLALVPPAVLWIVPLAVPLPPGRTWPQALPFLAGAALVLLLESDADLGGWTREDQRVGLSSTGLAVGAMALTIAAIAPGVLPGYDHEPWVDLGAVDDPRGYQPIVDVGDRLKLPEARDVLEVRADRRVYLRLAALETFDGRTWRLGPADVASYRPDPSDLYRTDGLLPPEEPIAVADRVRVEVEVLDLENIYVPVPYQVERIRGEDGMFYSLAGGFVATGQLEENEISGDLRVGVREGFSYQLEAVVPSPSYTELRDLGDLERTDDPLVALPTEYADLRALAEQVYADAGADTTIDRVLALQEYFVGDDSPFTYSTDVPSLRGDLALQDFVFGTQSGYCEYFSTAMAVMLRATGIPARVAVGFLPGRITERADPAVGVTMDSFRVSTTDAHAWVEVLFDGYGWVRMDPTPRSDGATLVPGQGDLDPLLTQREIAQQEFQDLIDGVDDQPGDDLPGEDDVPTAAPSTPETPAGGGGVTAAPRRWPLVVALLTGALGFAALAVAAARRPRGPFANPVEAVLAAQRRLLTGAARLGLPRRPHETISEVLVRWAREGRSDEATALHLAHLCRAAAFGGDLPDNAAAEAAARTDEVLRDLAASVSGRARALAPVRRPVEAVRRVATDVWRRGRRRIRA